METEKAKEHAKKMFNRIADRYEATFAGRHSARMKKAALASLEGSLRGSLLDVGCGPGLLLTTLAVNYPELRLAGLDIDPEMIRVATERLGMRPRLNWGTPSRCRGKAPIADPRLLRFDWAR